MKRAVAVAIFAIVYSWAVGPAAGQSDPPRLPFKAEAPLELPEGMYFGEVAGVAVNSKGHVFVSSRSNKTGPFLGARAAQILEFDPTGKFIREIGRHLFAWAFAETVRIDKADNIWAVDKGSGVIVAFAADGRRVINSISRPTEPQEYHPYPSVDVPRDLSARAASRQPTDIAWDSLGNFYVTDGYERATVQKYDQFGDLVKTWGERGTGPGQFFMPHGIAIDDADNIYVADRGNARIQVFNTDGKFLRQFTLQGQVSYYPLDPRVGNPLPLFMPNDPLKPRGDDPAVPQAYPDAPPADLSLAAGAPEAICITPGPNQVLYIGDTNPSRIYKVSLEGKVLGMLGNPGGKLGEFRVVHSLTCVDDHTLWVADLTNWRAQKITLR